MLRKNRRKAKPSDAIRRTEKLRRTSRDPLDCALRFRNLQRHQARSFPEQVRMRVGMVADLMPLRHDAPRVLRKAFDVLPAKKERGADTGVLQDVKDQRCRLARPVVERKRDCGGGCVATDDGSPEQLRARMHTGITQKRSGRQQHDEYTNQRRDQKSLVPPAVCGGAGRLSLSGQLSYHVFQTLLRTC